MSREPIRLADLRDPPSPETEFMGGLIRAQREVRPPEAKIEELVARLGPLVEKKRPPLTRATSLLAASAAVIAAVAFAVFNVSTPSTAHVDPATMAPANAPPKEIVSPPPAPPESAPAVPVEALPSVNAPKAAASAVPRCDEVTLIDAADRQLRSGDPERALAAVRDHEHRCPAGVLVQERERIAIEALAKLGRLDQARARVHAFEQRFPTSPHLRRARQVVEQ